eukprot:g63983.t1
MLDEILRSETRKTESPNKAPEEEKSNEQDAEEEEEEEEVEDNTNTTKTTKSKARCQGRYWPVPEHVRELGYLVAPFIGLKEFWDDLKDKREDRLPKKGSVHPVTRKRISYDRTRNEEQVKAGRYLMRALMGQCADSDGKPVWKGRTDYPSDVQRLTVAVLQGEFGFTLKGARDVISIRLGKLKERKSKPYSNKEHIGQNKIVKGATVQPGQSDDESEEDTDSEEDKDEEEEGGKGKKKI